MKIHLPKGANRTQKEQTEWTKTALELSKVFHAKTPPEFPDVALNLDALHSLRAEDRKSPYITPMWQEHMDQLMAVAVRDPEICLRDPVLQYAFNLSACGVYARQQIPYLEERYSKSALETLLKEGAFPGQVIVDQRYGTSETRVNHLTHLTAAARALDADLAKISPVVEFGGGYGGMAHLLRTINPKCTHIIVDLPEMVIFQSYTLGRLFGPDALHVISAQTPHVQDGKINFVSIEHLDQVEKLIPTPEIFIATWSLSEANFATNLLIQKKLKFFQARRILFGYRRYAIPNPRQPESRPLELPEDYEIAFHGPCFFALQNEQYYLFAKK
jgi:hypothetical protein